MLICRDVSLPPCVGPPRGADLRRHLGLVLDDGPGFGRGNLAPVDVLRDVVALFGEHRVDAGTEER